MKTVKKTAEYTIFQRNDDRYAVRGEGRKWINGEDKVAILKKEKLLKTPKAKPKAKEEEAPVEAEVEAGAAEGENAAE